MKEQLSVSVIYRVLEYSNDVPKIISTFVEK